MRAIDLGTNIIAPACVGFVMSWMSVIAAAVVLCVWNIVSMVVEYLLLTNIYQTYPALAEKTHQSIDDKWHENAANKESLLTQDTAVSPLHNANNKAERVEDPIKIEHLEWLKNGLKGWIIYTKHEIFPAGFGLALLYMTVLTFDHILAGKHNYFST
jgi:iron-regulated transporter 1